MYKGTLGLVPMIMVAVFLKRYKSMIRISIFFFCIGCGIALCFIRVGCAQTVSSETSLPVFRRQVSQDTGSFNVEVEYAVLVLTSPDNDDKRNVIRNTWGKFVYNLFMENGEKLYKWSHSWTEKRSTHPKFIKVYFIIGTKGLSTETQDMLRMENTRNDDMVFLDDLTDKYENLALKVKLSFKWFHENLKELKYVIKCDDDSFVRIDLIVKDLEAFAPEMNSDMLSEYITQKNQKRSSPSNGLYWGYINGRAKVNRKKGKWQEQDWFLCDYYLPYALGGGYVVSRSIVDFIAKNADLLSCYRSEDVSVGLWTAPLDGINRVHDIRFDTEWESRGCINHMLVRHKQNIQDMFHMYKTLVDSKGEILCKTESFRRLPYDYDWRERPSQCCSTPHELVYG